MNNLQIFNSEEFGAVRTVTINGEPWFVGKDVAEALRYSNASKAVSAHVEEEDRILKVIEAHSQNGNVVKTQTALINESGLYALIFGSKLESAQRFKHWVTSEVLPAIRKTGGYQTSAPQGKELLALAVLEAQKTIEAQNQAIERMKPKEIFADAVKASDSSILIGDLAKLLRQNGVDIGAKRLFEYLRNHGYLIKRKGSDWNMPTQKSMNMGLFEIKESTHIDGNGCNIVTRTPKATGKAQIYFVNKFLGEQDNERFDQSAVRTADCN
ncbi:phage antirepressor [Fusicatenibacter saccharivorans]|uniref:phage antirepressor n=1 Tax=Fusicatenibacter saccharivorans TaxID=1150298 RepID=UPI0032BF9760